MNRIILSLLLITSCAFAQYETQKYVPPVHEHKGLYFSANPGLAYTNEGRDVKYDDGDDIESKKFSGILPFVELRIGRSFVNMASFYGALGLGLGDGTFKGEEITNENGNEISKVTVKDDDDGSFRFSLGGGVEIYPIQNKESPMYGIFVGANAGFVIDLINVTAYDSRQVYKDSSMIIDIINLFGKFDIGKEWWFTNRWSLGFALNYTFGRLYDEQKWYNYRKEKNTVDIISHKSHTFGLMFRVTH